MKRHKNCFLYPYYSGKGGERISRFDRWLGESRAGISVHQAQYGFYGGGGPEGEI